MTEQLRHPEKSYEHKVSQKKHEEAPANHERPGHHHEAEKQLESLNKKELGKLAKEVAKATHETPVTESEKSHKDPFLGLNRDLKAQAYEQSLKKIRSHLTPVERKFSKVIHHPVVETASEIGSRTLARPSGIIGGGVTALVGGMAFLYMASHFGFEYNFFVYLILLIVGFVIGVFLELVVGGVRRHKSAKS